MNRSPKDQMAVDIWNTMLDSLELHHLLIEWIVILGLLFFLVSMCLHAYHFYKIRSLEKRLNSTPPPGKP